MCEKVFDVVDNKFNGWKNKPTWLVNVWGFLDDFEQHEDLIKQVVDNQMKWEADNPFNYGNQSEHKNRMSIIYFQLGERLEEYVTEFLEQLYDGETKHGLGEDLINWSLAIVDWKRLAECLEEPVKEYLKEEHSVVV